MTALTDLGFNPFAELRMAAILSGRVNGSTTIENFYVSSASGFSTLPTENPPNTCFRSAISSAWSLTSRVSASNSFLASGSTSAADLVLSSSDGTLARLLELDTNNQAITVKLGARYRLNGTVFPWGDYETILTGYIQDVEPAGADQIRVRIRGERLQLDQAVVDEVYLGYGGRLVFTGPTGDQHRGRISHDASVSFAGDFTVEGRFTFDALPGAGARYYAVAKAASGNYELSWLDDGRVAFAVNGTEIISVSPISIGSAYWISCVVSGTTQSLYLAQRPQDLELVASGTLPATPTTNTAFVDIARRGADRSPMSVAELRFWSEAHDIDTLANLAVSPITDVVDYKNLTAYYRLETGLGAVAYDSVGVLNMALFGTNGPLWESTLEGGDPSVFNSQSPVGETKPDGWGAVRDAGLELVDPQRNDWHWSRVGSEDLSRLYSAGAPLVPEEIVSGDGANFTFTALTKSINVGVLSAHRFIAGQAEPARNGQRIQITGSALNNATLTIDVDGISQDGKTITVIETIVDETGLGGSTITITSHQLDVQYTYDLDTSSVRLTTTPTGALTADAKLRMFNAGDTSILSTKAFETLTGRSPDVSELIHDPEVGILIPAGAAPTRSQIVNQIMWGCCGLWAENADGTFRLWTIEPPAGAPAFEITEGQILSIRALKRILPYKSVSIGYDRTWQTVEESSVPGQVSASRRKEISEDWRLVTLPSLSTAKDVPLSVAAPMIETYLTKRKEAQRTAELWRDLITKVRMPFDIELAGVATVLGIRHNSVGTIQSNAPNLGITTPALVRVLDFEQSPIEGTMRMRCFA